MQPPLPPAHMGSPPAPSPTPPAPWPTADLPVGSASLGMPPASPPLPGCAEPPPQSKSSAVSMARRQHGGKGAKERRAARRRNAHEGSPLGSPPHEMQSPPETSPPPNGLSSGAQPPVPDVSLVVQPVRMPPTEPAAAGTEEISSPKIPYDVDEGLRYVGEDKVFEDGDRVAQGQQGKVVGSSCRSDGTVGVRVQFPGNKSPMLCRLTEVQNCFTPPLPSDVSPSRPVSTALSPLATPFVPQSGQSPESFIEPPTSSPLTAPSPPASDRPVTAAAPPALLSAESTSPPSAVSLQPATAPSPPCDALPANPLPPKDKASLATLHAWAGWESPRSIPSLPPRPLSPLAADKLPELAAPPVLPSTEVLPSASSPSRPGSSRPVTAAASPPAPDQPVAAAVPPALLSSASTPPPTAVSLPASVQPSAAMHVAPRAAVAALAAALERWQDWVAKEHLRVAKEHRLQSAALELRRRRRAAAAAPRVVGAPLLLPRNPR